LAEKERRIIEISKRLQEDMHMTPSEKEALLDEFAEIEKEATLLEGCPTNIWKQ